MIKKGNNIRFGDTIFVVENFDDDSYLLSNTSTKEINWVSKKDLIENLEPITFKSQPLTESSNVLKKTYFKNNYLKIIVLENKNHHSKINIITESEIFSKQYPYSTNRAIYEFNKFFNFTNELTPLKLKKYGFICENIFYATQRKDNKQQINLIYKTLHKMGDTSHKPINESFEQSNLNDNFWKWFNDSKIVDKNGNPIICYHCTNQNFNTFDKNKFGTAHDIGHYGKGFYFSLFPNHYYGKKCLKCYLNIKNPYFIQYTNNDLIKEFSQLNLIPNNLKPIIKKYNLLKNDFYKNANINVKNIETKYGKNKVYTISYKNKEFTTDELGDYLNSEINDIKSIAWNNLYGDIEYKIHKELYSNINSEQYTNAIKKLGYDGIIVSSSTNNITNAMELVVFEPNQIKSVDNNGVWNFNSNNIYESSFYGNVNWQNNMKALGNVSATIGHNLFATMFPFQFLKLCPPYSYGDDEWFDKQLNERVPYGIPFLKVDVDERNKQLIVTNHEGRHRVASINRKEPNVDIPVAILYNKDRYTLPDIHTLRKEWSIISQDGKNKFNVGQFSLYNELPQQAKYDLYDIYKDKQINESIFYKGEFYDEWTEENKDLTIWKNPSADWIKNSFKKTAYGAFRFIYNSNDRTLFIWDANEAVHNVISDSFDIDGDIAGTLCDNNEVLIWIYISPDDDFNDAVRITKEKFGWFLEQLYGNLNNIKWGIND